MTKVHNLITPIAKNSVVEQAAQPRTTTTLISHDELAAREFHMNFQNQAL